MKNLTVILIAALFACQFGFSQEKISIPLNSFDKIELVNLKGKIVEHHGEKGLRVLADDPAGEYETLVLIKDINFKRG